MLEFGEAVKRARAERGLSQADLADLVYGDPTRKGDISRIENGLVKSQADTIQKFKDKLGFAEDAAFFMSGATSQAKELDALRAEQGSLSNALDNLQRLTRSQLIALAAQFEVDAAWDLPDASLHDVLTQKAEEYRRFKAQIDGLDDRVAAIANLKGAAQDAADKLDFDEVEALLSRVDEVETEIAAETKVARADNALLRGRVEDAYRLLTAAADSFASVDPLQPAQRRLAYSAQLGRFGSDFGGMALGLCADMCQTAIDSLPTPAPDELACRLYYQKGNAYRELAHRTGGADAAPLNDQAIQDLENSLALASQNTPSLRMADILDALAIAQANKGERTTGKISNDLLAKAIDRHQEASEIYEREASLSGLAKCLMNLGNAYQSKYRRSPPAQAQDAFVEARASYQRALVANAETKSTSRRADIQMNFGRLLVDYFVRMDSSKTLSLLEEAEIMLGDASNTISRQMHPLDWARTQINLGLVHMYRGPFKFSSDSKFQGAVSFSKAASCFELALEILTPKMSATDWAHANHNLASVLYNLAGIGFCKDRRTTLNRALDAINNALRVHDPVNDQEHHAQSRQVKSLIEEQLAKYYRS